MQKYYRVFEITGGSLVLYPLGKTNWHDTVEDAEKMVRDLIAIDKGIYTILPVYDAPTKEQ